MAKRAHRIVVGSRHGGTRRWMFTLQPCKRFDFSWADWFFAVRACLAPPPWAAACEQLERRWAPDGSGFVSLSVRSAFDLFLRTAGTKWQAGDEIIFTALTIPHMPSIARRHGFQPVAADIDPLTGAWNPTALEALVGPRTRAVVAAHLFGARMDLAPTLAVARRHNLVVVEDCAQAYAGPNWRGHDGAHISLFSFGPLKTATAFGSALACVRDAATRHAMRHLSRQAPAQPTGVYLRRLLRYGALQAAANPLAYRAITALANCLGLDVSQWIDRATRSLRSDTAEQLRRRPCAAALAVLDRRIREGSAPVDRRRAPAQTLLRALGPSAPLPTARVEPHGRWMIPALCQNRDELRAALRLEGFDAMRARLAPVADGEHPTPGANTLAEALCLPFDPRMTERDLLRLAAAARPFLLATETVEVKTSGDSADLPESPPRDVGENPSDSEH